MTNATFKEFSVKELFTVKTTKSQNKNSVIFNNAGPYDFIGRTSEKYGVQGRVNKMSFEPNPEKTFSLVQVGETVCLYRENKWYASQNIFILTPLDDKIAETHLFFEGAFKGPLSIYAEAYKYPTLKDVEDIKIKLPVTSDGKPDYKYMSELISELEQERISELEAYLEATGLDDYELTPEDIAVLQSELGGVQPEQSCVSSYPLSVEWKEFKLTDIGFAISHGKRLKKEDRVKGNIPFITAGVENRGFVGTIGNNVAVYNNPITVDMFGNCFYQSMKCSGDDNIYFFNSDTISEKVKLFISTAVNKQNSGFYSYTNQYRQTNANEQTVLLPVTPTGSLNFKFMEDYITAIEKTVIKGVVEYKNTIIAKTKNCINN